AAMTAPKPYSDAGFTAARRQPDTAVWLLLTKAAAMRRHAKIATVAMPSTSAASTAQIPTCLDTSIASGFAAGVSARIVVGPYHRGMSIVKRMFVTATTASGRKARNGDTVAVASTGSGSL